MIIAGNSTHIDTLVNKKFNNNDVFGNIDFFLKLISYLTHLPQNKTSQFYNDQTIKKQKLLMLQ